MQKGQRTQRFSVLFYLKTIYFYQLKHRKTPIALGAVKGAFLLLKQDADQAVAPLVNDALQRFG